MTCSDNMKKSVIFLSDQRALCSPQLMVLAHAKLTRVNYRNTGRNRKHVSAAFIGLSIIKFINQEDLNEKKRDFFMILRYQVCLFHQGVDLWRKKSLCSFCAKLSPLISLDVSYCFRS